MKTRDHLLEIERGRYKKILIGRMHCSLNETEDENHFFFNCPLNLALRNELLVKIEQNLSRIKTF